MTETYTIAGGDMRFAALAEALSADGKIVRALFPCRVPDCRAEIYMNSEGIPPSDYLILPVPVTTDGENLNAPSLSEPFPLERLEPLVKRKGCVLGGKMNDKIRRIFEEREVYTADYLEREELTVMNALATAEGAVMTALQNQDRMLFGQKVLIIGMGRIAKALIRNLSGFGADITAAARKPHDLAWAKIWGCKGLDISELHGTAGEYTLIFNTVPSLVIDEYLLKKFRKDVLIIDLASLPGGTDFSSAERLGIRTVHALGLPGKTAPVTSGYIIADTIRNIVSERRSLFE